MKTITFQTMTLALVLLLCACQKTPTPAHLTTYTVKMEMNVSADAAVQVDLTAFEYNEDGEKIANNTMERAVKGTVRTYTANSRAVKVKILVKMYAVNGSSASSTRWVQQVYYLEPEKNTNIRLQDDTKIGLSEP